MSRAAVVLAAGLALLTACSAAPSAPGSAAASSSAPASSTASSPASSSPSSSAPSSSTPRSPAATPTSDASPAATPPVTASPSATTPPSAGAPARDAASAALASMTLEQRVGQLLMVGGPATGVHSATRTAVTRYHVGNLMLTGRSTAGVRATARVSAGVQALTTRSATAGVPLLVATDQEGGAVQVLRGTGFTRIPSGLVQGGWSTALLRSRAQRWGAELRAAGVRLDLAPVTDTVPAGTAAQNAPIGRYGRQFGSDPAVVGAHAVAFDRGMQAAGVATSAKHFPGLGRVRGNTDVTSGVVDRTTGLGDLGPFAQTIRAGVPLIMMSTAIYARLDPGRPAAFSPVVIGQVLRGRLGFGGVVISDDLGQATQVASVSPGQRAVRFVAAGGDLVLTVDPTVAPAMYRALLARARVDPAFRARVDASAARVLRLKQRQGLLR